MKKAGDEIVKRLRDELADDSNWKWSRGGLNPVYGEFTVGLNGGVFVSCLGEMPLTWEQRRSIGRAVKKTWERMREKLIDAGLRAQNAK